MSGCSSLIGALLQDSIARPRNRTVFRRQSSPLVTTMPTVLQFSKFRVQTGKRIGQIRWRLPTPRAAVPLAPAELNRTAET